MSVNIKQNGDLVKVANNISIVQANWNDKDNTSKSTCIRNQPATLKTLEEISVNIEENALAGAYAVKELKDSLTNENNESFNFGVKDGVRGFYTDPSRADDSFIPFSSSKIVTGEFNAGSKVLMIDLGFKPKFLYVVNKDFSQLRIYDESYSSEKIFSHTISASEGAFNSLPNSEANNIQSITDNVFTYGIVTSESFKAKRYVAFK